MLATNSASALLGSVDRPAASKRLTRKELADFAASGKHACEREFGTRKSWFKEGTSLEGTAERLFWIGNGKKSRYASVGRSSHEALAAHQR